MKEIRKILYPTDFSQGADEVLSYAISVAEKYGAKIDLLHVVHQIADMTNFYVPHMSFDVIEKEMEDAARANLEKVCSEKLEGKIAYSICIRKGIPYREIISASEEGGSDIIVMGTHGYTAIDHVLFGSTAEKVVRNSKVPVLTVRPKTV
ncbi:MAG: universal stress protein [Proteobacteria bacterium]|nr:universal stress protein [Pseudomonadota bacterium]